MKIDERLYLDVGKRCEPSHAHTAPPVQLVNPVEKVLEVLRVVGRFGKCALCSLATPLRRYPEVVLCGSSPRSRLLLEPVYVPEVLD